MNDAERDVWLREALRHAPDADAMPPSGVSEAILSKARARAAAPVRRGASPAAASSAFAAFWDWLARPPVAAGFASVMAATLVGLMWWDRPMDETMPRSPSVASQRNNAAPPLASTAPATVAVPTDAAAPPAPRIEATTATAPAPSNETTKATADDSDVRRRQRSEPKQSAVTDAKLAEPAGAPEKREVGPLAKERPLATAAKNEAPAPFPAAQAEREKPAEAARPSLDAPATDIAKKADEARRSRAADAVGRDAAPSAEPSLAPAPFSEFAQRPRALGELREKDATGGAAPTPAQASRPATEPSRDEAQSTRLDKAQQADATPPAGAATKAEAPTRANAAPQADTLAAVGAATAAVPLARVLAAIAAEPARWSRRTAGGDTVALDAGWRRWLVDVDAAATGRWRPFDGVRASAADGDLGRSRTPRREAATTLRLVNDGRLAAVVRVDGTTVRVEAAPGAGGERWQAMLDPAGAERLRTTSRRLAP